MRHKQNRNRDEKEKKKTDLWKFRSRIGRKKNIKRSKSKRETTERMQQNVTLLRIIKPDVLQSNNNKSIQ